MNLMVAFGCCELGMVWLLSKQAGGKRTWSYVVPVFREKTYKSEANIYRYKYFTDTFEVEILGVAQSTAQNLSVGVNGAIAWEELQKGVMDPLVVSVQIQSS